MKNEENEAKEQQENRDVKEEDAYSLRHVARSWRVGTGYMRALNKQGDIHPIRKARNAIYYTKRELSRFINEHILCNKENDK